MVHYDINERRKLGKVRKKSTGVLILSNLLSIIFFWVISKFADKLILAPENVKKFQIACYIVIFVLILLLFVLIVIVTGPSFVLQNDLKNIYIVKKTNKTITIPVIELKSVKAKVKSRKKAKKEYGTLIIRTTTKNKYKIRNIYNVTEVKENIVIIVEKLQIYFQGVEEGSKSYQKAMFNN